MTVPSPTQTPSPSSSQVETEASENRQEKDSLHILPLSVIPLETASLKQARLLKDASLKTVVELFRDEHAGSARMEPSQLHQVFGWPEAPVHPDLATITALSSLNSYDVFSLRIELRRLNLSVNDHSDLQLSEDKNRELAKYMTDFTRPEAALTLDIWNPVFRGRSDSFSCFLGIGIGIADDPSDGHQIEI